MTNQIQVGQFAPNFVALGVYEQKFGKIRLSDYRGKKYVVLFFYPANFTPVSLTELLALKSRAREFRRLSTQILAISIDSPFSHLHYLTTNKEAGGLGGLNYPLISDPTQKITLDYQLLAEDGLGLPGLFIIDKEGLIQYYNVNNFLCGRSVNEILRILKSIQYIKENPGEACPADWDDRRYILPSSSKTLKLKNLFQKNYTVQKN